MRSGLFGTTLTLGMLVASAAIAQELPEPPWPPPGTTDAVQEITDAPSVSPGLSEPSARSTGQVWYGWQTLIVIGASSALCFSEATLPVGVAGILLGGPTVHWVHGHVGRGFGSLGLYVGLPAIALLLGGREDSSSGHERFAGIVVGLSAALVVDLILAFDDRPARSARRDGFWLAPDIRVASGGGVIGAVGAF
jgi:hypothetical protein